MYNKYEITNSTESYIDFTPKGITKAKALEIIGNKFMISSDEMIAFGDCDNDLEMLKYVGLSVAMANADSALKNNASFVTESNDNNGIAIALSKIFS